MALPQLFFTSALFKELVALDFIHYFAALTHDYVIRALQHNISRRNIKNRWIQVFPNRFSRFPIVKLTLGHPQEQVINNKNL